MRLKAHGGIAALKRDFTSIFMNIKDFIESAQNAHMIWVEPVCPFARKNKIRNFSNFNGLNGPNWLNRPT
jgi:hypothetical protein